MKLIKKIKAIFEKMAYTPEHRARKAGVKMGEENYISSDFWAGEPYLITIGSHCQITNGVKIFTHGGGAAVRLRYPRFDCFGKVVIGDYVYLGNNATVMPGVSIGNNVLVAACSVVTKSIPSNVVVGGNPASILCTINEYIERNLQYNLNSKGMSSADKKKMLERLPENKFIRKKNDGTLIKRMTI